MSSGVRDSLLLSFLLALSCPHIAYPFLEVLPAAECGELCLELITKQSLVLGVVL